MGAVMDLAPMDKCPRRKSGQHNLCIVLPDSAEGDLTIFCDRCGSLRRVPASGGLPLDDQSAAAILRAVSGDEA